MKQRLMTQLAVGQSLDVSDILDGSNFQTHTRYYSYFMVSGGSEDTVKIVINGVTMCVPGGFTMHTYIESLTVSAIYKKTLLADADIKIIAFGEQTKTTQSF